LNLGSTEVNATVEFGLGSTSAHIAYMQDASETVCWGKLWYF